LGCRSDLSIPPKGGTPTISIVLFCWSSGFSRNRILQNTQEYSTFQFDSRTYYGTYDGMATMTYRTTFALDKDTRRRLKRLSDQWQVSQAEVVRRALSQAENQHQPEKPNPIDALYSLHATGRGIARETAEKYLTEVRANREHWRGE